jgi:hypothetical protein
MRDRDAQYTRRSNFGIEKCGGYKYALIYLKEYDAHHEGDTKDI